jgi:hypothetical protein
MYEHALIMFQLPLKRIALALTLTLTKVNKSHWKLRFFELSVFDEKGMQPGAPRGFFPQDGSSSLDVGYLHAGRLSLPQQEQQQLQLHGRALPVLKISLLLVSALVLLVLVWRPLRPRIKSALPVLQSYGIDM